LQAFSKTPFPAAGTQAWATLARLHGWREIFLPEDPDVELAFFLSALIAMR
jgi:hypothetical protein